MANNTENSEIRTSSENHDNENCSKFIEPVAIGAVKTAPIVHLSKCVLYAPSPNGPPPTTRKKPLGCKTVFVGGLPENATEDIMREVFENSGEISTIRMSTKNFCHIRFACESFIDNAISFSGYRIKIDNKDDAPNNGRLHVDYAQARDDQFEYECRQRALQNETQTDSPPSTPPAAHYSDHDAVSLSAKLRDDDKFMSAVQVLISWLEHGECTKKNSGYFYSMIQSTNSHIHRLRIEKQRYENELNEAKMRLKQETNSILIQLGEIDKVFNFAILQKSWDHFTKAQRKNITVWKKDVKDIRGTYMQEVSNEFAGEMDLSDDDDSSVQSIDVNMVSQDEVDKLRKENDSLRCQLDASQNEVLIAHSELQAERSEKENQIQMMRQNMQNAYKRLISSPIGQLSDNSDILDPPCMSNKRKRDTSNESSQLLNNFGTDYQVDSCSANNIVSSTSGNSQRVAESEIRLIGLISTFLNAHPFGASIDYICSYLHQIDSSIQARDVENLMGKFPALFKEESTGIGASLEKKWTFCGFRSDI